MLSLSGYFGFHEQGNLGVKTLESRPNSEIDKNNYNFYQNKKYDIKRLF